MEYHFLCWDVKTWTIHMVKTMQYREKLKQSQKNGAQGNEIHNWVFTLLSQIFPGKSLFSYHPLFSLPLKILFMINI